jgi:hypothetical protein
MRKDIVFIDPELRTDNINADKLMLKAKEVAHSIIVPKGVEFAQFEHGGRRYALEAVLSIQVSQLDQEVSETILRDGALHAALETNKKRWKEEGRLKPVFVRR